MQFGPPVFRKKWDEIRDTTRFTSMWDSLRLHTWLRQENRPVEVACKYLRRNIWLRPGTSDSDVFREVFGEREYEVACWDIEPKLIIDAGANIGLTSLYFAERCGNARIVALEPEASNVDLLRRNTEAVKNITVKAGALWPRKASLAVLDHDVEKWAFSVREDSTSISNVAAFTVTDILAEVGTDCVDLLKIDIEGAEKELFTSGWQQWLPKVKRIVIELHDRLVPGCSKAFYSAILSRNFRQITHGQNVVIVFQNDTPD